MLLSVNDSLFLKFPADFNMLLFVMFWIWIVKWLVIIISYLFSFSDSTQFCMRPESLI